jgi:hypothetical protein
MRLTLLLLRVWLFLVLRINGFLTSRVGTVPESGVDVALILRSRIEQGSRIATIHILRIPRTPVVPRPTIGIDL